MAIAGYVLLSREVGLFRQMDTIAQNVANVNTSGYKADRLIFASHLSGMSNDKTLQNRKMNFANDVTTYVDNQAGALTMTRAPLDVAINGQGFFQVQTPDGIRYTRSGSFQVGPNSTLVNPDGYEVLSSDGAPITVSQDDIQIEIANDGTISATNNGNREERGNIGVVRFEEPEKLRKIGNSLFSPEDTASQPALPIIDFTVLQGALENSNVNSVEEVTRMIDTNRMLTASVNISKDIDDLERKAIQTISKA
jgi:flagellar basal-body rod protein FlgF